MVMVIIILVNFSYFWSFILFFLIITFAQHLPDYLSGILFLIIATIFLLRPLLLLLVLVLRLIVDRMQNIKHIIIRLLKFLLGIVLTLSLPLC